MPTGVELSGLDLLATICGPLTHTKRTYPSVRGAACAKARGRKYHWKQRKSQILDSKRKTESITHANQADCKSDKNIVFLEFIKKCEDEGWVVVKMAVEGEPHAFGNIAKLNVREQFSTKFFKALLEVVKIDAAKWDPDAFVKEDPQLGLDMVDREAKRQKQKEKRRGEKENFSGYQGSNFRNVMNMFK